MILLLSKVHKYIAGCNKVRTTNYTVSIILDFAPLSNYFILLIFELCIITILYIFTSYYSPAKVIILILYPIHLYTMLFLVSTCNMCFTKMLENKQQ